MNTERIQRRDNEALLAALVRPVIIWRSHRPTRRRSKNIPLAAGTGGFSAKPTSVLGFAVGELLDQVLHRLGLHVETDFGFGLSMMP